jgi:hypothetical protein
MAFKYVLNTPADKREYHVFYGNLAVTIPRSLALGYKPISVTQMMKCRLKIDNPHSHWNLFSYITGDAVVYHPDGRMKIIRDAKPFREVNRKSEFEDEWPHRIVLGDGVYESLDGLELSPREQRGVVSAPFIPFSPKRVRSNVIWQYLARNQDLLDEFIDKRIVARKKEWFYERSMQINFNPSCFMDVGTPGISVMYWNILGEVKKPVLEAIEFEEMRDGGNACLGDCTGFWRSNATLLGLRSKLALAKAA